VRVDVVLMGGTVVSSANALGTMGSVELTAAPRGPLDPSTRRNATGPEARAEGRTARLGLEAFFRRVPAPRA
jgi:hypothetical protein